MTVPSPASLGFHMPAEWEPHHATWIAWPHNKDDWPGKFAAIPWVYVEIVRHLCQSELVCILVEDERAQRSVERRLARADVDITRIVFHCFATDRVWIRDFGPIFIKRQSAEGNEVAVTNWHFNGWAKYPDWKKDNEIPGKIAEALGLKQWEPCAAGSGAARPIVLEGGSIDVNGQGALLTTEECLLSPIQQRNPGLSRADVEKALGEYLGIRKVLWLHQGIAGDDTHGHVDDLARFVNPTTVVTVLEDDPEDVNYVPLRENLERLKSMTDQNGTALEIVSLPMPKPLVFDGRRLPASYANFYVANKVVLVPTFNDPNDRIALSLLAQLFPSRDVIGIHSVDLVWGLGTLHCLSQQQPR